MKWTSFKINTTPEAEDLISSMLYAHDIMNIEVRDGVVPLGIELQGDFPELIPDELMPEDVAEIWFYAEDGLDYSGMVENLHFWLNELRAQNSEYDFGPLTIEVGSTDEEDWENNWKKFFHSFMVGSLHIVPSWEEVPVMPEADRLLRIDPGLAFGTGSHETTKLCILGIQNYLKEGDRVLDLGFGSGILSMVALKYGAKDCVGTDIDPKCVDTAEENFKANDLDPDLLRTYIGDISSDPSLREEIGEERYDFCAGNLLADILIPMAAYILPMLKKGAYFVTSGIINERTEDVKVALLAAGFEFVEECHLGDWANLTVRRPEA